MDSSSAGLGVAREWRWSGRFIASACSAMLIVAAGSRFPEAKAPDRSSCSLRNRHIVRQPLRPLQPLRRTPWTDSQARSRMAVYRSSGGRVRGEDDKIPPIKTIAPDLPLEVLRNMDIRVDPWSAPTCAPPNAFAHSRRTCTPLVKPGQARHARRNEWRAQASSKSHVVG